MKGRTCLPLFLLLAIGPPLSGQETSPTNHLYSGGKPLPVMPPQLPGPPQIPAPLLNSTEQAIEQQSRGDFPVMDRAPALPLGSLQRSWDRPQPANGQTAPGIIHYLWQADFVMAVRTRDFMVTTLMLPAWERIGEFYVGDPVVFDVKRVKPNVLAVRSRNAGADSNLTLLGGSGNLYNFYLRSEAWNSSQVTDLAVYVDAPAGGEDGTEAPELPSVRASLPTIPNYVRQIVTHPDDIRFDMKMFANRPGDSDIAPLRVFEDGLFTYFDFGDKSDVIARPVVHQVIDGVDTAVNSRTVGVNGSILVAEAIGDFTLRNGNRVVCVKRIPTRGGGN